MPRKKSPPSKKGRITRKHPGAKIRITRKSAHSVSYGDVYAKKQDDKRRAKKAAR